MKVFGSIGLWKISKDNALLSLSHKSATPTPNPPNLFPNHVSHLNPSLDYIFLGWNVRFVDFRF